MNASPSFATTRIERFTFDGWVIIAKGSNSASSHGHLALETGRVPLSRILHGLQSSYTQAFNRRHHRSGHLFQGRYKAFLVDAERYFLALLRYIHRNPLDGVGWGQSCVGVLRERTAFP